MRKEMTCSSRGQTAAFKGRGRGVIRHLSFDIRLNNGHAGRRSSESPPSAFINLSFLHIDNDVISVVAQTLLGNGAIRGRVERPAVIGRTKYRVPASSLERVIETVSADDGCCSWRGDEVKSRNRRTSLCEQKPYPMNRYAVGFTNQTVVFVWI